MSSNKKMKGGGSFVLKPPFREVWRAGYRINNE